MLGQRGVRLRSGARRLLHKSKSSRIARGKTPPSDADIRAWCAACGADD
ncbi:helix-turn-helix domain-containing protein, partial [Streptomyces sp. NPDC048551]